MSQRVLVDDRDDVARVADQRLPTLDKGFARPLGRAECLVGLTSIDALNDGRYQPPDPVFEQIVRRASAEDVSRLGVGDGP